MARPASTTVTEAEQAILDVLWRLEEASVREVTDALSEQKSVAYTTVLTMLGVLHRKGLVSHRPEGRAFIYRAAVSKDEVRGRALGSLLTQLFDGSAEALAAHLFESHVLDSETIDALRERIRDSEQKGKRA